MSKLRYSTLAEPCAVMTCEMVWLPNQKRKVKNKKEKRKLKNKFKKKILAVTTVEKTDNCQSKQLLQDQSEASCKKAAQLH